MKENMLVSSDYGCAYRLTEGGLEYALIFTPGVIEDEWQPMNLDVSQREVDKINEYFNTNFTKLNFLNF